MSSNPADFVRKAAEAAQAQGELTPQQAQDMIFAEGPKPFRYGAELMLANDGVSPPLSKWEFEVPNATVVGWLRKEDLQGLIKTCEELIKEMENPKHKLTTPPSGLIVPR